MEYISKEELEDIREKANIVDIISRYIQVQHIGSSYKAICPFHDDHHPSLTINPTKKIFRCYACNTGGSVFDFVNYYEKLDSFPKSVEKVADLIGYEMKVKPSTYYEKKVDPHIKKLREINEEAIKYTMYELKSSGGIKQKEYLTNRGIGEEEINYFKIGYNPYNNSLYQFLKGKGYNEEDLIEDNIVREGDNGIRDAFSGRIMFPIHDYYGNPIGFSARAIDNNSTAKYLNTAETTLFKKSEIVYNAHNAKNSARKEGKIYVCEGVTDVIAFYRAGIENAVCTLGKNSTKQQIRILKHLAPTIVICYDGDRAGQEGTWELAKMAMEENAEIRIINNNTGLDLDEIINKYGKDKLLEILKNEIVWPEYVINSLKDRYNLNNYVEKKEMAKIALEEINKLNDPYDKEYFTNQLSDLTGINFQNKQTESKPKNKEKYVSDAVFKKGIDDIEQSILGMMMNSEEAINIFESKLGYLLNTDYKMIAILIVDYYRKNKSINSLDFMDSIGEENLKNLVVEIIESKGDKQFDEKKLDEYINKVILEKYDRQIEKYKDLIELADDQEEVNNLFDKMEECIKEAKKYQDGKK